MTMHEVLHAFEPYIQESPYLDVCQSKFGYVTLHYNPGTDSIIYTGDLIRSPEEMLQSLKEEIVLDVLEHTEHDLDTASKEELAEIERRTEPFLKRLQGQCKEERKTI